MPKAFLRNSVFHLRKDRGLNELMIEYAAGLPPLRYGDPVVEAVQAIALLFLRQSWLFCFNSFALQTYGLRLAGKQNSLSIKNRKAIVCRGGRIRTYDLLLPKQARYRATLHPENWYHLSKSHEKSISKLFSTY